MAVQARVVPAHAVVAEAVARTPDAEGDFFRRERMPGHAPDLTARMQARQRVDGHGEHARNFNRARLPVDFVMDRSLCDPEARSDQTGERDHRPAGVAAPARRRFRTR